MLPHCSPLKVAVDSVVHSISSMSEPTWNVSVKVDLAPGMIRIGPAGFKDSFATHYSRADPVGSHHTGLD